MRGCKPRRSPSQVGHLSSTVVVLPPLAPLQNWDTYTNPLFVTDHTTCTLNHCSSARELTFSPCSWWLQTTRPWRLQSQPPLSHTSEPQSGSSPSLKHCAADSASTCLRHAWIRGQGLELSSNTERLFCQEMTFSLAMNMRCARGPLTMGFHNRLHGVHSVEIGPLLKNLLR